MKNIIAKSWVRFIFCAVIALLFLSCSVTKIPDFETPAVYVTNSKKVNILGSQYIIRSMDEVQLFEGIFGDRSFSMPLYICADKEGLYISMLNDVGTSMGELSFDGKAVDFHSNMFPKNMKAEYIVWDIQLAFYESESVASRLALWNLNFLVEKEDGIEVRKLMDGKKLIEEIIIEDKSVVIKNHLRGYEYHLTGVQDEL